MQVWNVLHAARWKYRTQNIDRNSPSAHHCRTFSGYIFATKAHIDNRKKLLNSDTSPTCPYNMVNFGLLAAEIVLLVWGTPTNFNGFRLLAVLLHGTVVVGVSKILRRWTEGANWLVSWSLTSLFSTNMAISETRVPTIFGRAAITLGIGAHSSSVSFQGTLLQYCLRILMLGLQQDM